jgi:nicotinamide riboside kinase
MYIGFKLDLGYSGWIKNANTISFAKFVNLVNKISNSYDDKTLLKMYQDKIYMPNYENENSIFYFVREPSLKPNKGIDDMEYIEYMKYMEGSAKKIEMENYCFEGVLILDGSFLIPVDYNKTITISIGDCKIKTCEKLILPKF